jgi:hypothetical protein
MQVGCTFIPAQLRTDKGMQVVDKTHTPSSFKLGFPAPGQSSRPAKPGWILKILKLLPLAKKIK